jgi:putative ABC transport system substrate-binding protein
MNRRALITLLGGTAASWPLAARAQQAGKIVTIGILALEALPPIDTFRQALSDLGYVEGKKCVSSTAMQEGSMSDFLSWRTI